MDLNSTREAIRGAQTDRGALIDNWVEPLKALYTYLAPEKIRLGFAFEVV